MDFSYLQAHWSELLEYLDQHGYSEHYRNRYKAIVGQIVLCSATHHWSNYKDVYEWYTSNYSSPTYLHEIRAIVGKLEFFHMKGVLPNGKTGISSLCKPRAAYHSLNNYHRALADDFSAHQQSKGLKESTVLSVTTKACSFLLELQEKGVSIVGAASPQEILSCFANGTRCGTVAAKICLFLRTSAMLRSDNSLAMVASYVPKFRLGRKNIAYLTDEEISKFHDAIVDGSNGLSLKSRAIGIILLYTGLRACDVAALTLDSVDWDKGVIDVTQQKTQRNIRLPLLPIIGNAIYDYCVEERPKANVPYLFVSDNAPHGKLTTDGIAYSASLVMNKAEVRMKKGDRRGTHIFRHHFATALLGSGVPQAVITEALGHSSPLSLESYLYADMVHLKECALSVEQFPVSEEVFARV